MRGSKFWDTGGNFFLFLMSLRAFLWSIRFPMLAITDLTREGLGLGRLDGQVILVAGALPGDRGVEQLLRDQNRRGGIGRGGVGTDLRREGFVLRAFDAERQQQHRQVLQQRRKQQKKRTRI